MNLIMSVAAIIIGFCLGVFITARFLLKKIDKANNMSNKHLQLYLLMTQWVKAKQNGKKIADFLANLGYKNVAIYGMSYVGERLLDELSESNVKVKYAIDKNAENIFSYVSVVTPDTPLEAVDAIIVTTITYFDDIEDMLSEKMKCPIIAIDDVIFDM